jgi:hypothetical protein
VVGRLSWTDDRVQAVNADLAALRIDCSNEQRSIDLRNTDTTDDKSAAGHSRTSTHHCLSSEHARAECGDQKRGSKHGVDCKD